MSHTNSTDEAYEAMLREHAKLRSLLDELKQILLERSETFSKVSSRLVLLRGLVEQHFRMEEENGLLTDLVSRAPRVSVRADVLITEHGTMIEELNELVSWASGCEGTAEEWDEVRARFGDFTSKLEQHETVENELLQYVFTEDIGSKD